VKDSPETTGLPTEIFNLKRLCSRELVPYNQPAETKLLEPQNQEKQI
jgi:hypothetical protein